jgi:hypothetical protein
MLNKTIEELEKDFWETPNTFPTRLVERVYSLRKKKIKDLSLEEIQVLITQNVGLDYLLPDVLNKIEKDPLLEAFSYPGDLLSATIDVQQEFWDKNPKELKIFKKILAHSKEMLENNDDRDEVDEGLLNSISKFLNLK